MSFEVTPNMRGSEAKLSYFRPVRLPERPNFKGFICEENDDEEAGKALSQMGVERAKKWGYAVSTNRFV